MANTNRFKDFEEIQRSIQSARADWESGKTKLGGVESYAGIWQSMNGYRIFMENERKDYEKQFTELAKVYNNNVIVTQHKKFDAEFDKMTSMVTAAFRKLISEFTEEKHKQVTKMVRVAPTESMRNLLETLKLRDDLDAVELHDIMPIFYENYHAMRALQTISRQNGITLNVPVQMDCTEMHKIIEEAHTYLMGACTEMFKPKSTKTHYNDFFTTNDKEKDTVYAPVYQSYIAVLDYVPQLQDFSAEKKGLSGVEKVKIDWYYHDVPENANDTQLAQHTKEIMEKYPEDVALLKMSKYAKYVDIVEAAQDKK